MKLYIAIDAATGEPVVHAPPFRGKGVVVGSRSYVRHWAGKWSRVKVKAVPVTIDYAKPRLRNAKIGKVKR